jgi:hypothetical protein
MLNSKKGMSFVTSGKIQVVWQTTTYELRFEIVFGESGHSDVTDLSGDSELGMQMTVIWGSN